MVSVKLKWRTIRLFTQEASVIMPATPELRMYKLHNFHGLILVAGRSRAWVCGRSLTGITGSNSDRGHGCLSLVIVVCCQVEVSATGLSLVQRSPAECDLETSTMRWPRNKGSVGP
jgi:hypothetical protein